MRLRARKRKRERRKDDGGSKHRGFLPCSCLWAQTNTGARQEKPGVKPGGLSHCAGSGNPRITPFLTNRRKVVVPVSLPSKLFQRPFWQSVPPCAATASNSMMFG